MRRILTLLAFATAFLVLLFPAIAQNNASQQPTAALLTVKGAIGPAVADFIERGIAQASQRGDRLLILQLDTPGGVMSSMRDINQAILKSPIPIITYVAPSGARAASAGTYILYASHIAAMASGTNVGSATPVSVGMPGQSSDKQKSSSEKSQKLINDARASIRSLAQLRGRNADWAEQAVTKASNLSAKEALQLNVINVMAENVTELLQKINGMKVYVNGKLETIQSDSLVIHEIQPDWRTKFLTIITDPSIAYILLIVGFYGLIFEFMNPGFVLPGVVGAVCLLIALYAFQLLPVNYVGLGLIIFGIGFIVAEAFIPSFGALGIGGVISLVVGSIMLMRSDIPGFTLSLEVIAGIAVTSILFLLLLMQLAYRSRRRSVVSGVQSMVGRIGVIDSNGSIWVIIDGERWKVQAQTALKKGQRVRIVGVHGLTLQVEEE